jgi:HTH-type transcriptional regulator/antitoxin MqsA
VRKKLNLGQKEAGKLVGGGVNAFSRYETGKTPPPVPLVKLIRILDIHPEMLSIVR